MYHIYEEKEQAICHIAEIQSGNNSSVLLQHVQEGHNIVVLYRVNDNSENTQKGCIHVSVASGTPVDTRNILYNE